MDYRELVYYIVRSLVANPDKVEINEIEGEKSTILELKVARDDMGKIIGKHGRIARAIRAIVNVPAVKNGKRVVLEILD